MVFNFHPLSRTLSLCLAALLVAAVVFITNKDDEVALYKAWKGQSSIFLRGKELSQFADLIENFEGLTHLEIVLDGPYPIPNAELKEGLKIIGRATELEQLVIRRDGTMSLMELSNIWEDYRDLEVLHLEVFEMDNISIILDKLPKLKQLTLHRCSLWEFPLPEARTHQHLNTLDLTSNYISELPVTLTHFPALRHLIVNDNHLEDINALKNYTTLQTASFAVNSIDNDPDTAYVVEEGAQLALRKLFLNGNNLDSLPLVVQHLVQLEELDVSENVIDGELMGLRKLTKLRHLNLANNMIDGELTVLVNLTKLQEIDLGENLYWEQPAVLQLLPNLLKIRITTLEDE